MSERRWVVVLGASSGFGEAAARAYAAAGWDVFGVHLDRRQGLAHVEEIVAAIRAGGSEAHFFNVNAADHEKRGETVAEMARLAGGRPVGALLHSLAFGTLKPFIADDPKDAITPGADGHDARRHGPLARLLDAGPGARRPARRGGARIFAMTSAGDHIVWKAYGAVSAAKCALESHIRQLAVELAPLGITANAIKGGVTDTPALRKIPGNEAIVESAAGAQPRRPPDHAGGRRPLPGRAVGARAPHWLTGSVLNVDGGEDVAG